MTEHIKLVKNILTKSKEKVWRYGKIFIILQGQESTDKTIRDDYRRDKEFVEAYG